MLTTDLEIPSVQTLIYGIRCTKEKSLRVKSPGKDVTWAVGSRPFEYKETHYAFVTTKSRWWLCGGGSSSGRRKLQRAYWLSCNRRVCPWGARDGQKERCRSWWNILLLGHVSWWRTRGGFQGEGRIWEHVLRTERERERNLLCMGGFKRWRWPITGKENAGDGGRFSFRPDLLNKNLIVINIKRK